MPPEGIYGEVEPQSHWSSGDDNIDEIEQLGRMMSLEEERQRSARFQTRVRRAKERYSSIIQGETTPDQDETSSSDGGKKNQRAIRRVGVTTIVLQQHWEGPDASCSAFEKIVDTLD